MKAKPFATEAELCAAFIAWVGKHPKVQCYAEWGGWDILLVFANGQQLGIQAKLRLNAEVILQAAPDVYGFAHEMRGPDFRGVLVPDTNPLSDVAARLGLVVFSAEERGYRPEKRYFDFRPSLKDRYGEDGGREWIDWNPTERHDLPPTATDSVAGSSCPVTLTHWKLGALDVLAELATKGTITAKRMRELGVNPSRWLSAFWLLPGEKRGIWVRGEKCPRFDEQHPTAYALALEKAAGSPAQFAAKNSGVSAK